MAHRDGKDAEYVVCALLHDVGEIFDPYAHDHVIAELLKNYISPENHFILKTHTTFQGYYYWDKIGLNKNARDVFRSSPYFDACVEFVEKYDDKAFNKSYRNMTLDEFRPMMMTVFSNRRRNDAVFE
jgi:predicted HD phosphohydrolase